MPRRNNPCEYTNIAKLIRLAPFKVAASRRRKVRIFLCSSMTCCLRGQDAAPDTRIYGWVDHGTEPAEVSALGSGVGVPTSPRSPYALYTRPPTPCSPHRYSQPWTGLLRPSAISSSHAPHQIVLLLECITSYFFPCTPSGSGCVPRKKKKKRSTSRYISMPSIRLGPHFFCPPQVQSLFRLASISSVVLVLFAL